jgi:hypothetical protein
MINRNTPKLIAAIAAAALVATAAASATPGVGSPRTLTLLSVQNEFTSVPPTSKASPPRIGDRLIFSDDLYNRRAQFGKPAGAKVGSADNVCTIVSRSALQCTIVAHLPNGSLVATGSIAMDSHTNDFAVTGGVGAYSGTRGTAHGRDLSESKSLVVLQLSA